MRNKTKRYLMIALKEAGLPHTLPNFILKYENKKCGKHGKSFLTSPLEGKPNKLGVRARMFSEKDLREIVKTAKVGWFDECWHWPRINDQEEKP